MKEALKIAGRGLIKWITFGTVDPNSFAGFLKSPLPALILFAVFAVVPLPWGQNFDDSQTSNVLTLADAALLLLALLALRLTVPRLAQARSDETQAGHRPQLPRALRMLVVTTSTLLIILLARERFFAKSFLVKWPAETSTHDVVIGGTFKNVDFEKERLAFYVCTEVPDRVHPQQPPSFDWRCWLDQHPPDVQFHDGLWQATCRFGNEEGPEMDKDNPDFDVVTVITKRGVSKYGLQGVVDSSPSRLRSQLKTRDDVSCVGPPYRVKRWTKTFPMPYFKSLRDSSQELDFGTPPALRYSVCPNAKITWRPAPGVASMPSYEVYFDGIRVQNGDAMEFSIADLLGRTGRPALVDEARWQRRERLELKISHDPMGQHYRTMYLYRNGDSACN